MLTPDKIAQKTIEISETKATFSIKKTLLLSILAGAFIALAGVGATLGSAYGGKIASALIFPIGLIMVVIAGSELFTGNNLMITAWIKNKITLSQLLKNWLLVFIGNFIGAITITALVVFSGTLDNISDSVIATATTKSNLNFFEAIIRGILCNFLVCIAVWMSFGAKTIPGKILSIIGPVFLFVLCGFEHSIANMFYGPAGIFATFKTNLVAENLNFGLFLTNNLLPVTIGNIIGGAGIVGFGYYLIYLQKK